MESTLAPMVLGAVMIVFTSGWFSWVFWDGMRQKDTPRRESRRWQPGEPGPWWTNDGFDDAAEPLRAAAELSRGAR